MLTEDSFVLWLLEKKKQEILKKDAMIEWLAENCVYMASIAFPFSGEKEEEMKKQFLKEAEQAVREGRKWGEMPKSTEMQDAE